MISVIIPIYNQEKYIEKCLMSIKEQTYQELQIIMIDDGSTDGSVAICQKYLEDSRFSLFSQKNSGVSQARNKGLEHSRGEWIAFVDPDDYLSNDYFERLLIEVESGTDIVACCCNAFDENGFYESYFFKKSFCVSDEKEKKMLYLQLLNCDYGQPQKSFTAIGVPWGKLYSKKFLDKYNLRFNPALKRQQDNIFNMYAFYYAETIKYVNIPLYNYRLDNIKNYYLAKYNADVYRNFVAFQNSRYTFLKKHNFFNDNTVELFYYNEALDQMIHIMSSQTLNNENRVKISQKRYQLKKMVEQKYYALTLRKLSVKKIKGISKKVLFILLKYKLFILLILVFKVRNISLNIKNIKIVRNGDDII